MSDELKNLISSQDSRLEQGAKIMEKVFSAAQPGAVFGEPVTVGNFTVITASEVTSGGGFGTGFGIGPAVAPPVKGQEGQETAEPKEQANTGGGGMGGGGGSRGRPVAIITIGQDGVKVEPVMDVTAIALAALTAWGAMLLIIGKMRKG